MKLHIPLILLSALLATAPVKANLAEMATIPGHPAFIPDYDYFIVENNPSSIIPPVYKVGCFFAEQPRGYLQYDFRAMAFFKRDANMLALHGGSIESLAGSIILKDVLLNGTSLTTKADGIDDEKWGLPQVAIDGVVFGSPDISVTSNYCTIRNWSGADMNFLLGITGASFERGTATGNVSITSLTNVKINTLAITNGGLSIHDYSPIVEPKDWLVELCNIEVSGGVTVDVASNAKNSVKIDNLTITNGALSIDCFQYSQQYAPNDGLVELNDISASGGVTVDAPSNYGRINVNNLTTGSSNVASSLLAREINLYGEINCDQLNIQAGGSVALDGCVLSCNQLTISSIDANKPDITCNGSINVQGTATLTGRSIYGTFVKADLSANEWKITADECVDYTGALRGNKQTITAKNVKLSGDVSGDTINISASEEVALAGNMKVEKYLGVSAPDIELQGSIIGQRDQPIAAWVSLKGETIRKTKAEGDFIAVLCDLEATREVNIQGTIQVGALVVEADKAITLDTVVGLENTYKSAELTGGSAATISVKSFLGDDLTVTSGGSIMLAAIGSLENPVSKAVITGQSDKPVAVESFIGDTLTVTAGGEITLESVGSLEKPVDSVTITSTSIAPVSVQSFHGGENGKLTIESRGIVTIGKQKEQGKPTPIPQYEGNIAINYLGSGAKTKNDAGEEVETWAVAMEGEVVGSLMVNAVDGAVNAGHITGLGSVQAKRIDLASFEGSDLELWASSSVNVIGNIQASGAVTIQQLPVPGPIVPDSVDINITTTEQIEAKEILLRGGNITCSSESLSIFAENYLIDAVDKVTINGTMQGDDIIMNAVGDITLGKVGGGRNNPVLNAQIESTEGAISLGTVNIAGTEEKPSAITAATKVAIINNATLSHTNVTAPQVTVGNKLTLQDQSSIAGDVTASKDGTKIMVENSAITGKVSGMEGAAMTVNLTNATIGSAEQFSRLEVQSASRITSDLVVNEGAELSFVLNLENLTTPVLTIDGELKVADLDSPAFTINLTGSNLPVLEKYALITTTNKAQAPEFWAHASVSLTGLSNDETTLFWEGGTLYFSLGGPKLEVATWTGAANFQWNTQDVNWKQNDATYLYKDGVAVVFNDTGNAGEVLLNGTLTPRSVLVENSQGHDYTFSGEGEPGEDKLTGKTVLVKQGSGKLTINTANEYTGGTTLNGGTLVIGNTKALGTGNVVLGNATLNLDTLSLANNITVTGQDAYLGNGTLAGTLNVEEDRKLTLLENTSVTKAIHLGDDAVLDMGGNKIDCSITLGGDVTLGNGEIAQDLTVAEHRYLILSGDLAGQGTIILGDSATLNLGGKTLSNKVELKGNATVGNGWIAQDLTVGKGNKLSLGAGLGGSGTIFLSEGSVLDLSGHSLSNKVELKGNAYVFTGYLHGDVEVGENLKLTLLGSLLPGGGVVHLGNNATLDLNTHIFFNAVTVTGNATISNGILNDNILTVTGGSKLTMGDGNVEPSYIRSFILEDGASANLGGNTFTGPVSLNGDVAIGNGTLNADVSVGEGHKLTLCDGNLGGSYVIRLAELSQLDLGGQTLTKNVELGGSASIGNGSLDSNLTVGDGFTLTLSDNLEGKGTIILNEKSHLNTYSGGINPNILYNAVKVAGNATICGTFEGKISVDAGKELIFESGTSARSGIDLGQNSALDLGTNQIYSTITLVGDAAIGNGTVNADVAVGDSHKLTLTSNLGGTGTIILNEQSSLNTHGDEVTYILSNAVKVAGNASIQGSFSGKITVNEGKKLVFNSGTTADGGIDLAQGSELDLGGNQTSTSINLAGDATIGSGTINDGSLDVAEEKTLNLRGNVDGTRTISLNTDSTLRLTNDTSVANKITGGLSATIVQTGNESATLTGDLSGFIGNVKVESRGALNILNADSMDNVTVDVTLGRRAILGVYKDANAVEASEGTLTISADHRLAAAFHAQLNANLVMESGSVLDVSATGGESGGLHMGSTVTLDPGNVLLSEADMDAVNGLRYMQAYDLFSGVDGLSLDDGAHFLVELGLSDPWVKASEVFANDLFKSAEREYYLFYSGKNQGGAVGYEGTVYLMRLPEPATGTLSLLALATLAARRRRK